MATTSPSCPIPGCYSREGCLSEGECTRRAPRVPADSAPVSEGTGPPSESRERERVREIRHADRERGVCSRPLITTLRVSARGPRQYPACVTEMLILLQDVASTSSVEPHANPIATSLSSLLFLAFSLHRPDIRYSTCDFRLIGPRRRNTRLASLSL